MSLFHNRLLCEHIQIDNNHSLHKITKDRLQEKKTKTMLMQKNQNSRYTNLILEVHVTMILL